MVYGCDAAWWIHRRCLPDFAGLKVAWAGANIPDAAGLRRITLVPDGNDLLFDRIGHVGGGGNSGFQAFNLVLQLGARRVLLIGFDMADEDHPHWYGRNRWMNASNPNRHNFRRWLAAFERAAPVCKRIGAEVVNCSPVSALQAFPRRSVADAMKEWA